MGFNLGDIIKGALPFLASALPGPLGSVASKVISGVLGVDANDEDGMKTALAQATPEQWATLKKAEQDFQVRMAEMGFKNVADLEKIAADDRASAREREIAVKDITPRVLAYSITIGFFGILGCMLFGVMPQNAHDALMILLGALSTAFAGIIAYYFGSSSGSAAKQKTIDSILTK